jgi:hypothetical protein
MNYISFNGTVPTSFGSFPDNIPLPVNCYPCDLDCILAFPNVTLQNGSVVTSYTISNSVDSAGSIVNVGTMGE